MFNIHIPYFSLKTDPVYDDHLQTYCEDNETTAIGYIPSHRAKQLAIISGLAAAVFLAYDFPEKISLTLVSMISLGAHIFLKHLANQEKVSVQKYIEEKSKFS